MREEKIPLAVLFSQLPISITRAESRRWQDDLEDEVCASSVGLIVLAAQIADLLARCKKLQGKRISRSHAADARSR